LEVPISLWSTRFIDIEESLELRAVVGIEQNEGKVVAQELAEVPDFEFTTLDAFAFQGVRKEGTLLVSRISSYMVCFMI
jgi:hypothetical protein